MQDSFLRHDWTLSEIQALFVLPFPDLIYQAHTVHRQHFNSNVLQICSLLNIKSGNCPEDCAYCAQSSHNKTQIDKHDLLDLHSIIAKAKIAKANGAKRFCMGAAWRSPPKNKFAAILNVITAVKSLGLETCMTLGMLSEDQVAQLKIAGLDYYNHNIDTSPEYYSKIITTHNFQERLTTLQYLCNAKIKICCGGIIGLGEARSDRISFLHTLATFPQHPHSVPINNLIPMEGTPLARQIALDTFEIVKVIAVARIIMPCSAIKLAGGREKMHEALQALCFFVGANAICCGEKLLTAKNIAVSQDQELLRQLGYEIES
jgi:biotin synthase